jgi:hypothetical protein
VGAFNSDGAAISVVSVPGESPFAQDVLTKFPTPFQMMVFTLKPDQNTGPFTIDLRMATATTDDGRTRPALDTQTVLQTSSEPDFQKNGMATFPQFVTIPHGVTNLSTAIALFPADVDLHSVASFTFRVNEKDITVSGRFLSAEEKQENVRRAKANSN